MKHIYTPIVVAFLACGCGDRNVQTEQPSIFETLSQREMGFAILNYDSMDAVMSAGFLRTDLHIVRVKVTDVKADRYFIDDNLLDVIEVKTQAEAQWVVLRITAEAKGLETKAGSIQFGVMLPAATDPAGTLEELSKSELVVVLFAGAFAYDPTLLAVAGSGAMIGVIAEDGSVTFPGIPEEFREQLSAKGITIESLETLQAEG